MPGPAALVFGSILVFTIVAKTEPKPSFIQKLSRGSHTANFLIRCYTESKIMFQCSSLRASLVLPWKDTDLLLTLILSFSCARPCCSKWNLGTAKQILGPAKRSLYTAKKKKNLGTARRNPGTAKRNLGTAKRNLGTAKKESRHGKRESRHSKRKSWHGKKNRGTAKKTSRDKDPPAKGTLDSTK